MFIAYIRSKRDNFLNIDSSKITGVHITKAGSKHYFLKGKRHREDGPAIDYADGHKEWFLHGRCHKIEPVGPNVAYR